ncbi:MAG: hypothetical protein JW941_09755 [Candidatus Coatesbacteria bacterium]|nr:hypothetical protein [Candidatus Coatesbacteria bacterium]
MNKAAGTNAYYAVTEKVFGKLTHEAVWGTEGISPLKRFKEGETAYITMCPNPSHQGARQSFVLPKNWPGGTCKMCGYRGTWLTTAIKKAGTVKEGVALLAQKAGVDISSLEMTPADWEEIERTWKKLTVFGVLSHYFSKAFQRSGSGPSAEAKSYFKDMGLTERALMAFPVGIYTTSNEIRQYLEKMNFKRDFADASGIISEEIASNYPLLFGYGDAQGNITGFVGTDPGDPEKRMPVPGFTQDLQDVSLFGLEQATPMITSERSVWMAASEVDAIAIQHESNRTFKIFKQMVSLGTGLKPSQAKFEALRSLGAEHFIFITPTTREGRALTNDVASIICSLGVKADVMPLPEGVKDLKDLIETRGFDHFDKGMVSHSGLYSIGRWLGKELGSKYDLGKEGEVAEARRAAAKASVELASADAKEFVYEIGDALKWDPHFWCIVLEQLGKTRATEDLDSLARSVSEQMESKRKDDLEMGFSWSVSSDDLEEVAVVTVSEDELMRSFYNPRDVLDAYEASTAGLEIGVPSLDQYISLRPGEMTLVSGLPGSGKTTFCIQAIANTLRNTDDSVLFFSFENTRMSIFNMLIANEFEIPFDRIAKKRLESGGSNYQKFLNAAEEFTKYRDKLVVIEEPFHSRYCVSDIQEICQMMSANVKVGLVLVDTLGMLAWDRTSPIENEIQLGTAARELLDTAKRINTPILVTNTPWIEHSRIEGGDLVEAPISISLRVEPYTSSILSLHHRPYSQTGETGASNLAIDRLSITIQKNSIGEKPRTSIEVGFDAKYRRLIDISQ